MQPGQIVAQMDDSNLQGQLTQARAQLSQQEANLNKLLNGTRSEEIAQARSQVEQRQQALNLLKAGSRPEDIAAARAQVESAHGALQTIQRSDPTRPKDRIL